MPLPPREFSHIREKLLQDVKLQLYALEHLLDPETDAAIFLAEARDAVNDAIRTNRQRPNHVQSEGVLKPCSKPSEDFFSEGSFPLLSPSTPG